jgi:hypothetical protein
MGHGQLTRQEFSLLLTPAPAAPGYTRMTRDDALAICAYRNSLDPVKAERGANVLD